MIDSNVLAVANHLADHADLDCVAACIERLLRAQREERVVIDHGGLIIGEYHRHCTPWNPQRTGDQFLRWLLQVHATPDRCRRVSLTETGEERRPFAEFPDDALLAGFHTDDHKYVAAAVACGSDPPIVNAVDTDWSQFRAALEAHGLEIEFVCPQHMPGG